MKSIENVIVRPLITEKSMESTSEKRYSFEVAKDATKAEIAKAVNEEDYERAAELHKELKNLNA